MFSCAFFGDEALGSGGFCCCGACSSKPVVASIASALPANRSTLFLLQLAQSLADGSSLIIISRFLQLTESHREREREGGG